MEWLLDPGVTHLNHGSYGACPRPVTDAWQESRGELERGPADFLWRRLPALLDGMRASLGKLIGARPEHPCATPRKQILLEHGWSQTSPGPRVS